MDINIISKASNDILQYLDSSNLNLKPDEKIAALDTASATIRAVLSGEALRVMFANILQPK
jgi:hypothetical protein